LNINKLNVILSKIFYENRFVMSCKSMKILLGNLSYIILKFSN